ncbi:hypothetical protein OIU84_020272 [Salix udensis]|uniref:Uncharacterized protein n=1 Tax=Salix udensis TaxID=889485 RepID=A0AAD6NNH5_9ROSI|nr:hypothetical protein OIU84_020272 [Salix udensis]
MEKRGADQQSTRPIEDWRERRRRSKSTAHLHQKGSPSSTHEETRSPSSYLTALIASSPPKPEEKSPEETEKTSRQPTKRRQAQPGRPDHKAPAPNSQPKPEEEKPRSAERPRLQTCRKETNPNPTSPTTSPATKPKAKKACILPNS